jgi:type II secretory pathway pseudopilin PulG
MLELIFVIVVIGILAVLAMPSFNANPLKDAAEQVAEHIRYTQHLAMVDDKYDPTDPLWYRENWQIEFTSTASNVFYTIYSDADHLGSPDNSEIAIDPLYRDRLTVDLLNNTSTRTDLKHKYGIASVTFSTSCSGNDGGTPTGGTGKELSFDTMGRPYFYITAANPPSSNIYKYLLKSDCTITLSDGSNNAVITVRPETGYVSVSY